MISDVFKMELIDDLYYEVRAKQVTVTDDMSDVNIGGNKSAEAGDEEDVNEATSRTGIDVVLQHRLEEAIFNKKTFQVYIKGFLKRLTEDHIAEDRKAHFKAGMVKVIGMILKSFNDWVFYTGEKMDSSGMVACLNWKSDDKGVEYPYMLFWKDAMIDEKV